MKIYLFTKRDSFGKFNAKLETGSNWNVRKFHSKFTKIDNEFL